MISKQTPTSIWVGEPLVGFPCTFLPSPGTERVEYFICSHLGEAVFKNEVYILLWHLYLHVRVYVIMTNKLNYIIKLYIRWQQLSLFSFLTDEELLLASWCDSMAGDVDPQGKWISEAEAVFLHSELSLSSDMTIVCRLFPYVMGTERLMQMSCHLHYNKKVF